MTKKEIEAFLRARHKNFFERVGEEMLGNISETILLLLKRETNNMLKTTIREMEELMQIIRTYEKEKTM